MKGFPGSPQPQRNSNSYRGNDARAMRGLKSKNKDQLGSDRDRTYSIKHSNEDQFGSEHNADKRTAAADRLSGKPRGKQDIPFRESKQDVRVDKGRRHLNEFGGTGSKRTRKGHG